VLALPARRVLEVGLRVGTTAVISQVLSLRDVTWESELDEMKTEFLSTAAHELRTPMASIFGFAELMLHRRLKPEAQAEVLETIHRQSALMITIVNELLDLARIEARRGQDFVLEDLDLVQFIPELLRDFKPPQQRQAPTLAAGLAPAWVRADRNKLRQALGNVLSNAFKYSPGGGAVQVQVLRRTLGQPQVGIEIRDSGIGMTPEQLARVSERFYRADASGSIPGTGLGMSIVREIVELLGGTLALQSTPQQGTTVVLWLPALPVMLAAPPLETV
jgi:signal transduction histidine kinase